ncbi:MAG: hypothetical protein ACE5E5_01025 [Phycisphaerae bacterium]
MRSIPTGTRGQPGCYRSMVACACGLLASITPAFGQTETFNATDRYGNVRARYSERRSAGLFQNSTQRQALRGFQANNRRPNNRGGLVPFSLSTNRTFAYGARQAQYRRALQFQNASVYQPNLMAKTGIVRPSQRYAFERYGGFAPRKGGNRAGDLGTILARPSALTQANALNAPVDRAMWRRGSMGELAGFASDRPFEVPEVADLPEDAPTLAEQVHVRVSLRNEATRASGWDRFVDGDYRPAARAFEGAYVLQPSDHEARLGEFFSFLCLGATRSCGALVKKIAEVVPNPFLYNLQFPDRLASPDQKRELLILVQRFAEADRGAAYAKAVQTLVLWHLGERAAARDAAHELALLAPDTPFADWPEKVAIAQRAFGLTGD